MEAAIEQAALFGEARPWNSAIIVPAIGADNIDIEAAIKRVNALLPDYACVTQWLPADAPFGLENSQLSGTGRLRRATIFQYYQECLDVLYQEEFAS
jgi:hypothetical protein